jgi:hypothetical protein
VSSVGRSRRSRTPARKLVNYKPHDSSIGRLRKKPHPHVGPNTKRIEGVETTNYRVGARLVEMKLEDDRNIHLVVAVPSAPSKAMIVEFPDTTCNGARSSPKKAKMARARSAIIAACGQPSSSRVTKLSGRATVTGAGFFDIPHGQTGIAPNAIELHPVLKFSSAAAPTSRATRLLSRLADQENGRTHRNPAIRSGAYHVWAVEATRGDVTGRSRCIQRGDPGWAGRIASLETMVGLHLLLVMGGFIRFSLRQRE